jgi:geranylgeranyl diphosphate synthase type I
MMTIKEFQKWFDAQFFALLEEKIMTGSYGTEQGLIKPVLSYVMTFAQGGKRLRPYLLYVGYVTEGGEEEIFAMYAAMELFHLFCLVHDDVMDNEEIRHDGLTVHKHFEKIYDSLEVGRAIAILIGDILLAWAYECVEEVEAIEPYTIDDASRQFRIAVAEVIHGQMLDILLQKEQYPSHDLIKKKMILKSARYSFFHPLSIGMTLAGADEEIQPFVEEYATNLGMAFQMQDDINDYAKDVERQQQTVLSWYMQHDADKNDQLEFEKFGGKDWSAEDEARLKKLLEQSGALSYAEGQSEEYFLAAEDAIFNHDKTGEEIWQEIIEEVKEINN